MSRVAVEMITEQGLMTAEQKQSEKREPQRLKGLWWAVALLWAGSWPGHEADCTDRGKEKLSALREGKQRQGLTL